MFKQVVKYKTMAITYIVYFRNPLLLSVSVWKALKSMEKCMESQQIILMKADLYVLEEFYTCHNQSTVWGLYY